MEEAACKQHDEEVARLQKIAKEQKERDRIEKERLRIEAEAKAQADKERLEAENMAKQVF